MGTEFGTGFGEGESGDVAGQAAAEQALSGLRTDGADFAVVFCSPSYDCEAVIAGVRAVVADATLVGATTAAEFTERGVHTSAFTDRTGVTVALVASDDMRFFTGLGRNVSDDPEASVADGAADLPTAVEGFPHLTGLVLSSAPRDSAALAHHAYQQLPIEWGGGGANDPTMENIAVFVDDEIATDAVALTVIASKRPVALGVGNRHAPIGGSVEVTKSDGNTVHELDGRPAYEVWKDLFDETAHQRHGFGMAALEDDRRRMMQAFSEFVFGVRTGEDTYKVRSPWLSVFFEPYAGFGDDATGLSEEVHPFADLGTLGSLPQGALRFAEPMPEGMVLYPMTSGEERTVQRGTRSAHHALAAMGDDPVAGGLVFECPCGEATLQEDYHRLIEAVADPVDAPIAGIQSIGGEICFRQDDMRGVNHTSTMLLLFPGGERT